MNKKISDLLKLDTKRTDLKEDLSDKEFFGFPIDPIINAEENLLSKSVKSIAYFSMEYGLAPSVYHEFKSSRPIDPRNIISDHEVFSNIKDMDYYHYLPTKKMVDLPIYSGGLGVLAGDTLKSAADRHIPLVGLGILWDKGYFKQKFWFRSGGQWPEEMPWDPDSYPGLVPLKPRISIPISGTELHLRLWKYYVYSYDLQHVIPLVLLDAEFEENPDYLRELTHQLYRSYNGWIKICQRMILGIGGVKALEKLGYSIDRYHLNEGHAALAFIEKARKSDPEKLKAVFKYTCHTPVEAGHDRFNWQELEAALGKERTESVKRFGRDEKNASLANLTQLAMNTSSAVNGVAQQHGRVMHLQFPAHKDKIKSITNGIHTYTWISQPIRKLLLKYKDRIGDFETNPGLLANVVQLKNETGFREDLWQAHLENKKRLADFLKFWFFKPEAFTLGWARRIAVYKRPALLFQDINRLARLAKDLGPLQIVIAGKAHPEDMPASMHMDEILRQINLLNGEHKTLRICFLENYDTYFAKLLTSSVDLWLNNPLPPFEASGTSGMKAILNGVVQLTTLDGWVVEAADKGLGRIFGYQASLEKLGTETDLRLKEDSSALYDALTELLPEYYSTQAGKRGPGESKWLDMMVNAIAASGYFNTDRMVREYEEKIWQL
ncbi:MAG: alpha-glucan family phosphorylase [Candidatus Saganbacteria bacterium]|nr:alpha-glucan family phosphorylase [Candidatus Saganbacteria bacterium]